MHARLPRITTIVEEFTARKIPVPPPQSDACRTVSRTAVTMEETELYDENHFIEYVCRDHQFRFKWNLRLDTRNLLGNCTVICHLFL